MLRLRGEERVIRRAFTTAEADKIVRFGVAEKLGRAYDGGLTGLAEVWEALESEAEVRSRQLLGSQFVHDLDRDVDWLAARVARRADQVRGRLAQLW